MEDGDYLDDYEDYDNNVDSSSDGGYDMAAANSDRLPLVPSEYSSLDEGLQNFVAVFESRYGINHPNFYMAPLQAAMQEAFGAPGRDISERKPFALYIHNDNAVACNIFAQQILCSETVAPLLKGQYVTWGWDVTYKENKTRLMEWLQMLSLNDIANVIAKFTLENYPLLLILIKDRATVMPFSVITGHESPEAVIQKLMEGLDAFVNIKNRAAEEERARLEREQIRAAQVAEYELSKAQDKAKQEERERLARLEREEEEARKRAEEATRARQEKLKNSLPSEPAAGDADVITIRIRYPTGEQNIRRFRMAEPVKWLVTYCESVGYDMEKYRLFTSDVPKKDVATLDNNKSFHELRWPPRDTITIDEK